MLNKELLRKLDDADYWAKELFDDLSNNIEQDPENDYNLIGPTCEAFKAASIQIALSDIRK